MDEGHVFEFRTYKNRNYYKAIVRSTENRNNHKSLKRDKTIIL